MRIVSWNVENLARRLDVVPEALARFDADVLCVQEVRIRRQDVDDVARLETIAPGFVCHHSLPRDPKNVTFRGGRFYGVATYIRESLAPIRAEVPEWDLEGRFVISHLPGLVIGNVYAVNGTDKSYFDHSLGRSHGDRHAFKRRFQKQVIEYGRALGARVILTGDWNVTPTKMDIHPRLRTEGPHAQARAELAAHITENGFVDIWRRLHPEDRAYSWFNPRARNRLDAARVDYVLVTEELAPLVTAATIPQEPEARAPSDHAPCVVDLSAA